MHDAFGNVEYHGKKWYPMASFATDIDDSQVTVVTNGIFNKALSGF